MNVIIVEDDKIQRENLKKMIQQIDKSINIYESEDMDDALEIATAHNIGIFYIDISLKNSSGLDFAIEIRKTPKYEFSLIIFLTTHVEYISKAFKEVHCYDYILKPYDIADVMNMTKRYILNGGNVQDAQEDKRHAIFEIRKGINVKVYLDEIIFVEINLGICMIHTVNGVYKTSNSTLRNVLKRINCSNIIQCHKSFIVNVKQIKKIQNIDNKLSKIYFENYDKNALLGYKYKKTIMERFQQCG
ncbi:MAG: LytTR family DNA-binding domain-containing protein [Clostridiaceae bacterium]|nr:LytTR family DNA-binding domain-containing protein [Clostridiaceae bacterium]